MADISTELQAINNAKFGREVRYSIYQAIDKINTVAEGAETTANSMQAHIDELHDNALVAYARIGDGDDLDNYITPGTWYWTTEVIPANLPPNMSVGRLVVFGSPSATMVTKIQLAMGYGKCYYRYGRISEGVAQWSRWAQVLTSALNTIGASTDLNDYTGLEMAFWNGAKPINSPDTATVGRIICFGSSSETTTTKVQLAITSTGAYYRIGTSPSAWGAWQDFGKVAEKKKYVAIGASTTVGRDGSGNTAERPYPWWVGVIGNFEVHNLAVSGTDFVQRGSAGTNYMDVLTSSANAALLSDADLITVWMGTNDADINPLGVYDDYYAFTPSVSTEDLYADCTKAGAMNFIIKYVSENFPKAQLMFVLGPKSPLFSRTATVTGSKVVYTAAASPYAENMATLARQVCSAANVPLADASESFGTVWNKTAKYNDASATAALHPRLDEYDQYGRNIAAAICAKYHN